MRASPVVVRQARAIADRVLHRLPFCSAPTKPAATTARQRAIVKAAAAAEFLASIPSTSAAAASTASSSEAQPFDTAW